MNNPDLQVNNSLALAPSDNRGLQLTSLRDIRDFAQIVVDSGLAPKSFSTPQQVIVALVAGAELGISPMQSLQGLSVVQGKIGVMGDLGLALCEAQGVVEDKETAYEGEGDSLACRFKIKRKGRQWKQYSFSVKEAKAAGIYERSAIWKSYPKRMTYYRCLGFALRDEFSDVMKGLTLKEELDDYLPQAEKKGIEHAKPARVAEPERVVEAESVAVQKSQPDPQPEPEPQTVQGTLSEYVEATRKDGYNHRAKLTLADGSHYWLVTGQPHLGKKLALFSGQSVRAAIVPGPYSSRQDVVEGLEVEANGLASIARAKAKAQHEGPDDLHKELSAAEMVHLGKIMDEDGVGEGSVLQAVKELGWDNRNPETLSETRAGVLRTIVKEWTSVVAKVRELEETGRLSSPASAEEPVAVEVGVEE